MEFPCAGKLYICPAMSEVCLAVDLDRYVLSLYASASYRQKERVAISP